MAESLSIVTEAVGYEQGGEALHGFLAVPETSGKSPAVVIFHDWMGESEYTRGRAKLLAEQGYVGFSADMFGAARPKNWDEAPGVAGRFYSDRPLTRARAKAALEVVAKHPSVDASKIVAIGYCFGGTVALELARSGANISGATVFHGGLNTPNTDDAKNIKGKILAMQGGDDPWVAEDQVAAFISEMRAAKVDWELIQYGGCAHAFTNPNAGSDISKGMAYNPQADKRSWARFVDFLAEVSA
jgi:dienelactone hydrolase